MRVLTLSTLFPDAGRPAFGRFVERQTQGLAARPGVAVRVVAPIGVPPLLSRHPRYAAFRAVPLHEVRGGLDVARPRFPVVPGPGAVLGARLLARRLLPMLRRLHADFPFNVIDAEFFWPDGPAAVRLGAALGVPVSIKARGADIHYWGTRRGCAQQVVDAGRAAAGLLAVSGPLRADMIAAGMPADRIAVHHTGVDQAAFTIADRAAAKTALGLSGPVLLSVGHLIPRKGQAVAIAALAHVPGATLLLAGEGPDRAMLERAAETAGVADRVRFLGNVAHAGLPALFAAADLFVLPTASEGLANVWVESLACGVPVVTTDIGGAREVIDRPAAGRLVPRDPAAFANAIHTLLADPPAREATRAAAQPFSWGRNAEQLEAHLRALVAAGAGNR
ncbi:glycosyltransferase [Sphingomonas montana]|uniref:glycosyltransferase n=1 Tax=Sphingomonas montana TaxID=1843236 RepID=UPI00096EB4D9|nr:glycosyltransferase [Sphingomonas montana]